MSDSSEDEGFIGFNEKPGDKVPDSESSEEEQLLPFEDEISEEDEEDDFADLDEDEENEEEEDDEEDEDEPEILRKYRLQKKKEAMADDFDETQDTEGIPSAKAWGKKKGIFYGTDYVDKDFRRVNKKEIELAEAEEREARELQQRLLKNIDESDLGFKSAIQAIGDDDLDEERAKHAADVERLTQVEVNISSLSMAEKQRMLKKESPEFAILINDFQHHLSQLRDEVSPLLNYTKIDNVEIYRRTAPYKLYLVKYHLLKRLCLNIAFYFLLKSKSLSVKNHPLFAALLKLKQALKEVEKIEAEQLCSQIQSISALIRGNSAINVEPIGKKKIESKKKRKLVEDEIGTGKKVRFQKDDDGDDKITRRDKDVLVDDGFDFGDDEMVDGDIDVFTSDEDEDIEQMDDLLIGQEKPKTGDEKEEDDDEDDEEPLFPDLCDEDYSTEEEELKKELDGVIHERDSNRPINYQIAKNKGLTIKRKKEYRNPRVRHRNKYSKAMIKRKGQVREPKVLDKPYRGESSGIKKDAIRSVKFK